MLDQRPDRESPSYCGKPKRDVESISQSAEIAGERFAAQARGWSARRGRRAFVSHLGYLPSRIPKDTMEPIEVRQTERYATWFGTLRDRQARARIDARIRRLSLGNPGDARPVGEGVSELRIDYGPGYRVYFARRGTRLVILLAGGDKRTQDRDIKLAIELARGL